MFHRLAEVAGDGRHGRKKKIAEVVSPHALACWEAVLEQAGQQGLVFGERHNTIAHIAGRRHVQLFAQPPAGTAVVAHRDDGREIVNTRQQAWKWNLSCCADILLQAVQQRGQSGAPAHGDNFYGARRRGVGRVLHVLSVRIYPANNATGLETTEFRRWYRDKAVR